ncbi:MAG: hypothetical protein H0T62_08360 [Parachlamydiaceae bacterium]|nr:hypothetical protein [Parachlamydiaceae bacterium]
MDNCSKTVIFTAINAPKSNTFLLYLIHHRANVNLPSIHISNNISTVTTPLDMSVHNEDVTKTKLLLQFGAQRGCRFAPQGIVSGDFNINDVLIDKADCPSEVIVKAHKEIKSEKFQFFLGLKDQNSIVSALPKDLIQIMLFDFENPTIKKKS